MGVTCDRC
jgi:hypothetical protein